MTPLELTVPFSLGLVSSLHCAQMCGPIVLSYSLPLERARRGGLTHHLAYNAGRITTYSALGAAAGATGSAVELLGEMAGVARTATMLSGFLLLLTGVLMLCALRKPGLVQIGAVPSYFTRVAGRFLRHPNPASKLLLGLVLGLLPCGLIYAALLKSLEAGSAFRGALSMLAFGAGTAGALLAVGMFSSVILRRVGRYANLYAAAGILLLGAYLVWFGLAHAFALGGHSAVCH